MNNNKFMFVLGLTLIFFFVINIGNFNISKIATDSGFDSGGSSSSSGASSKPLTEEGATAVTAVFAFICVVIVLINVDKKIMKKIFKSNFVKILIAIISLLITLKFYCLLFPDAEDVLKPISNLMIFISVMLLFVAVPIIITKINKELDDDYDNKQRLLYLPKTEKNLAILEKCYKIFVDVQEAWMNFDYDKLREVTTDELYNMYYNQLQTLKLKEQKNVMHDFELINYELYGIDINNGLVTVRIRLEVEFYDYIIDKNEKVISGYKNKKIHMIYDLTYVYNDSLKEECPNCSAILSPEDIECKYCKSKITGVRSKMKLSTKKRVAQL